MTTASFIPEPNEDRLRLDTVTLCAVSSSNLQATVQAMKVSLAQIEFAQALLFTDRAAAELDLEGSSEIQVIPIDPLHSSQAYSQFMLSDLADHISTDHALIVQWDGHVIDAGRWQDAFLEYDYIGASWPQFDDGFDVGNGGFSLRSRKLLEACRHRDFSPHHPEDLAIGRTNRSFLESQGLRFASKKLADLFSAERTGDPAATFGYHGVFLMPSVLGADQFWSIYNTLSDRATIWVDFGSLLNAIIGEPRGIRRALTFIKDRLAALR